MIANTTGDVIAVLSQVVPFDVCIYSVGAITISKGVAAVFFGFLSSRHKYNQLGLVRVTLWMGWGDLGCSAAQNTFQFLNTDVDGIVVQVVWGLAEQTI